MSLLNQNQPMIERPATGMITPQTVIAPIRPVTFGPPKFATVVSQISAITPMQVAIGVDGEPGNEGREVADRRDRDRDVADRERQEIEVEDDEEARLAVRLLGVGRHAARRAG